MTGVILSRANAGMTIPAAPRMTKASLKPEVPNPSCIRALEQALENLSPCLRVETLTRPLEAEDHQATQVWRPGQLEVARSTAHGTVVKKLTSSTQIKGHKVAAPEDNPEYLVETEEGKQAAHKAEALTKA